MANIVIRDQIEADFAAVHDLVIAAFKTMPYACGREQFVMDALWRSGAATVALVAEDAGVIVGQAAFSKVKVGGADVGWHGCGPLTVLPERHKQGIGGALVATAAGLFAAIPAVIAYNFFLSKIRVLDTEMQNFSSDFLNIIKRHFF